MSAGPPAPVRTLIVDDEPLARRRLRTLLLADPAIDIVGEAANGTAATAAIREKRPDLVLLDIQMPGKDGFAVLQEIAGIHEPVVIFVTAHDEHAIRAFDAQALDYVLKPVVEERLRAAVRRAITRLRERRQGDLAAAMAELLERLGPRAAGQIPVKRDGRITFVSIGDIQWVEADRDFLKLHTTRDTHLVRMTMTDLEAKLPAGRFARVHRSVLVNVACIHEIHPLFKGGYVVVLKEGRKLRTGRAYRNAVKRLLAQ